MGQMDQLQPPISTLSQARRTNFRTVSDTAELKLYFKAKKAENFFWPFERASNTLKKSVFDVERNCSRTFLENFLVISS